MSFKLGHQKNIEERPEYDVNLPLCYNCGEPFFVDGSGNVPLLSLLLLPRNNPNKKTHCNRASGIPSPHHPNQSIDSVDRFSLSLLLCFPFPIKPRTCVLYDQLVSVVGRNTNIIITGLADSLPDQGMTVVVWLLQLRELLFGAVPGHSFLILFIYMLLYFLTLTASPRCYNSYWLTYIFACASARAKHLRAAGEGFWKKGNKE